MKAPDKILDRRRALVVSPTEAPPVCVGIADAALLIGLGERTLRDLIARGEIPSFPVGTRVLILLNSLHDWAAGKEAAATRERESLRTLARQHQPPVLIGRRRRAS